MNSKRSGRPPKFREPRRPVTVTLPESTLNLLASIHPDRAQAIVKATDASVPAGKTPSRYIELVEVAPSLGIIIVGPSQQLKKIKWLRLVEIAPMRYLLTIPPGTSIDSIEVAIMDLLEDSKTLEERESKILTELRDLIRKSRRMSQVSKAEILFIDTRDEQAADSTSVKRSRAAHST